MTIDHSQKIPSDIAICFSGDGRNLTVGSFDRASAIQTQQFSAGESLYPALSTWRNTLGFEINLQTVFRFVPLHFTEQTHVAALPEEILSLDDRELTIKLIKAARNHEAGEDGSLIFESSLERSLYDYARLPNGEISLTEVPKERVHAALKQLVHAEPLDSERIARLTRDLPDDVQPLLLHAVETRTRAIARYTVAQNKQFFLEAKPKESMAFFAFTPEGCAFALWNSEATFFAEYGEWFNLNFDDAEIATVTEQSEYVLNLYLDTVDHFLHEQFYKYIDPDDESAPQVDISHVFWIASDGLDTPLKKLLAEFGTSAPFTIHEISGVTFEQAVVQGLLLGYDAEIEALVPSINLANDISVQNEFINAEEQNRQAERLASKRKAAFTCLMAPIVLAFAVIAGLVLNNSRVSSMLSRREAAATAEQSRLKPTLAARANYEQTLKWYQDVLRQIVSLRQKQGSSLSFAARLDPLYPKTRSFYISEMKLAAGGGFELKGLTRSEDEVSSFVKNLEFAEDERQSRYFTGLQLEFKQGSSIALATVSIAAGSPGSGNLASGVSSFVLKGNFAPANTLKSQAPAAMPAGNAASSIAPQSIPQGQANAPAPLVPAQPDPAR